MLPSPLTPCFQEIGKVALYNPANSDIYTVQMAQFVATFHRVAMPPEFKHLFFVQVLTSTLLLLASVAV